VSVSALKNKKNNKQMSNRFTSFPLNEFGKLKNFAKKEVEKVLSRQREKYQNLWWYLSRFC